jgi:hypothetical protein
VPGAPAGDPQREEAEDRDEQGEARLDDQRPRWRVQPPGHRRHVVPDEDGEAERGGATGQREDGGRQAADQHRAPGRP